MTVKPKKAARALETARRDLEAMTKQSARYGFEAERHQTRARHLEIELGHFRKERADDGARLQALTADRDALRIALAGALSDVMRGPAKDQP